MPSHERTAILWNAMDHWQQHAITAGVTAAALAVFVAARTRDHLLELERAVGQRFSAADLATFRAVLAAIEQMAARRSAAER